MQTPKVSFVVPCYNLAHFLEECVTSILAQHYENIEIIVLDDQSPDNTKDVAEALIAAHPHRRICYIRNAANLGNIRNYNKGISLTTGTYVWIISPDDRLRSEHVVEKYVQLMEAKPEVGFTFCPAHKIDDDKDMGVLKESRYRTADEILEGRQIVKGILDGMSLLAPSVMIRKACYESLTLFPEDMPHRGDSYVWARIALECKVGYFAEAMVDYRVHGGSMMSTLSRENLARIIEDDIAVPWRVKAMAEERKVAEIVDYSNKAIAGAYAYLMSSRHACRGSRYVLTVEAFEASVSKWTADPAVRSRIRSETATELYWRGVLDVCRGQFHRARHAFRASFLLCARLRVFPPARLLTKFGKRVGVVLADMNARLHAG
ncbi:glycosyltransferase involved in cell wall biosynthesis [Rhodoblastus acidophilus]|uniref:glycosyltransferase family 2 protein n=1 Tax=Rhodoblastus acidophilus TaxID=1074 RepID=UPI0022258716|nr:glycosyltransferase [Rhodoblastus acidophilus]MCW2318378.1 glycosyltransferase involved in cell wall biosynthesis [Rhodoblastus acidophilus]